jgi:hypothetical protein
MARKSTKDEIQNRVNEVYGFFCAHTAIGIRSFSTVPKNGGSANAKFVITLAEARKLLALDAELARPEWLELNC